MTWISLADVPLKSLFELFSMSAWIMILSPGTWPVFDRWTEADKGPDLQQKHPKCLEFVLTTSCWNLFNYLSGKTQKLYLNSYSCTSFPVQIQNVYDSKKSFIFVGFVSCVKICFNLIPKDWSEKAFYLHVLSKMKLVFLAWRGQYHVQMMRAVMQEE